MNTPSTENNPQNVNLLNLFVPYLAPTDEATLQKASETKTIGNAQTLTVVGKKTYLNTDTGKFEIALPPIDSFNLPADADLSAIAAQTIESLLNIQPPTPYGKESSTLNTQNIGNVISLQSQADSNDPNTNAFMVLAALFSLASSTGKAEYAQGLSSLVGSLRDTIAAAQERLQAAQTEMIGGIIAGSLGMAAGTASIVGGIKGDKTIKNSEKVKNPPAQPINSNPATDDLTNPMNALNPGDENPGALNDPAGRTSTPPPAEADITKTNTYTTQFSGKWAGIAQILNASGQMTDSIAKGIAGNKTFSASQFDAQAKALDAAMQNAKGTKEQLISFLQQILQVMKEQSQAKQDTMDTLSSAAGA